MPSFAAVKASNARYAPSEKPVLVVFGGTSGVGSGIFRAFARHTHGRIHIVILGRSQQAADALIASLPRHADSQYEFQAVDAVLMANVRAACAALAARLPKINYLVLSQAAAVFDPPKTAEGLHPLLALGIYGRVRAALDLAPLLERAAAAGEDARVLTVQHAGVGGRVDLDDVALSKASAALTGLLGLVTTRGAIATYTDVYTLELAQRFPALSVTHVAPGAVQTGLKRGFGPATRCLFTTVETLFGRSADACGEYMMYALLDPAAKTGAHFKLETGAPVGASPYADATAREVIWRHLEEMTDVPF